MTRLRIGLTTAAWLCVTAALSGCGARGLEGKCADAGTYDDARSVAPIRVPGELTPPDESEALRIPGAGPAAGAPQTVGRCLETPPEYFEGAGLGSPTDEPSRRERRRERRAQRDN